MSRHDPGGKVRIKLQDDVTGWARFSACERYRHELGRYWGAPPEDIDRTPFALWIGMNPSTATAEVDDPTIRREVGFTRRFGLTCYVKCNVMDYRATKPKDLLPIFEPCSPENLEIILERAAEADKVIVCFGALHKRLEHYGAAVVRALRAEEHDLWCLGRTASGAPRHPLYLHNDTMLEQYMPP